MIYLLCPGVVNETPQVEMHEQEISLGSMVGDIIISYSGMSVCRYALK